MRICYLADGRYIHTHRWLKYFGSRGHEMSLFSFAPIEQEHLEAIENAGARYFGELTPFYLKRPWRTLAQIHRLRRFLRREKIDVLHSHFIGVNTWYGAISRFHPTVITVMGGDILGKDWQPGRDIRERLLTPYALRNADLITCWSHNLTEIVRRYSRPDVPIEVVHGGIDLDRFSPVESRPQYLLDQLNLPRDARVILSPRLMRPLYNLDKIAQAADAVCTAVPQAYFIFAVLPVSTNEAYEAKVREILANGAARDRVRFVGAISHEQMPDYYRLADVTVSIPSSDGTPMSVLESMACRTPVLVSRIPNYDKQYIEDQKTVLMVDQRYSGPIATTLIKLLQDRSLGRTLATEAERRVRATGSYDFQMAKMGKLYESLATKKHKKHKNDH